jgi:hypothetical protein
VLGRKQERCPYWGRKWFIRKTDIPEVCNYEQYTR